MQKRRLNTSLVWERSTALGIDTISELARRLDFHRSFVSRVLAGERTAQPSFILKLAEVLDVRPAALVLPDHPDTFEEELRISAGTEAS